jgi:hypothetical protein
MILHLLRYKRYIDIEDVGHPIGNLVYCAIKIDELFEENGKNRSNGLQPNPPLGGLVNALTKFWENK